MPRRIAGELKLHFIPSLPYYLPQQETCIHAISVLHLSISSVSEKDLVLEIDRLRHHRKNGTLQGSVGGKQSKSSSSAPVDSFIKSIEDERNYWKNQVDDLQHMLRSQLSDTLGTSTSTGSRARSASPSRATSPARQSRTESVTPTRQKTASRAASPGTPSRKVLTIYPIFYKICGLAVYLILNINCHVQFNSINTFLEWPMMNTVTVNSYQKCFRKSPHIQ